MATWLIPALKAVLPHVGTIIAAAGPVFTKKNADEAANQPPVVQQQISELQTATSQNTTHIKELAAQIQTTVATLEQAVAIADAKLRRAHLFATAALVFALICLIITLFLVFTR